MSVAQDRSGPQQMHGMQPEQSTAEELQRQQLEWQLEHDESGELRDRLFGELHGAAQEIETALAGRPAAGPAAILQSLLQAVALSQNLILEVWDSFHEATAHRSGDAPAAGHTSINPQSRR